MTRKPVHLALYDTFADWETGHATAHLARAGYEVRTVTPAGSPSPASADSASCPTSRSPSCGPRTARC